MRGRREREENQLAVMKEELPSVWVWCGASRAEERQERNPRVPPR